MRREEAPYYRETRSPRREILSSELDGHANRIKELLKTDLTMLEEENAILKLKCKKVNELEGKVEMILRQNSQLLTENQKISKLLHESRSEYEILKNKFDSNMAQRLNYATEFQFQKKKLINEIDHLHAQINELQHSRAYQLNEVKSQNQMQTQNLKRQIATTQDAYEQEIRKLREHLDKKDYELSESNNKLKKVLAETEFQIIKVTEEKEKLKSQIMYMESDHRKEVDNLRIKMQSNTKVEIQAMKRNFTGTLNGIEEENFKLKDYLNSKGFEIQELSAKMGKQRNHFQETLMLLKKENESMRNQMIDSEKINANQLDGLKDKLHLMHENQIAEIKHNHQRYAECLQAENIKLEGTIKAKNDEIEQLIKQKSNVRQLFANETNRVKEEMESLHHKIKTLENQLQANQEKHLQKIREKQDHINFLDQINKDQIQNNEKELAALKDIIAHHQNELEQEKISNRERQQGLKETVSNNSIQLNNLKDQLRRLRAQKDEQEEELRNQYQGKITQLKVKTDTLTNTNKLQAKEIQSLQGSLELKEKQNLNLQIRVKSGDERERKLEKDNQDLRIKLIKKDQRSNELLADQKKRLESSFSYTLENLKTDHEAALKLERNKLSDAQEKINKKDKEIEELLKDYKKLREGIQVLTEQEANKKELTLKFPGATADLLATKNLFDVFLKAKVLDICEDAKQNQS